mmetsp:Transcript_13427/g.39256  ORF Transcript_13427/g.39256 Transcript_13427/m.39256 type:complete len:254 (+) Transcript_13427:693-1454(+)
MRALVIRKKLRHIKDCTIRRSANLITVTTIPTETVEERGKEETSERETITIVRRRCSRQRNRKSRVEVRRMTIKSTKGQQAIENVMPLQTIAMDAKHQPSATIITIIVELIQVLMAEDVRIVQKRNLGAAGTAILIVDTRMAGATSPSCLRQRLAQPVTMTVVMAAKVAGRTVIQVTGATLAPPQKIQERLRRLRPSRRHHRREATTSTQIPHRVNSLRRVPLIRSWAPTPNKHPILPPLLEGAGVLRLPFGA